jgi:hypothetical protein
VQVTNCLRVRTAWSERQQTTSSERKTCYGAVRSGPFSKMQIVTAAESPRALVLVLVLNLDDEGVWTRRLSAPAQFRAGPQSLCQSGILCVAEVPTR